MGSFRPAAFAHRAFTLIEMLVSLAILTIIAAVLLTNHASFSNSIIITNAAYDVALSTRAAQSYGVGSRGYGSIVNTGYGLDFSIFTPTSYRFFADTIPANSSTAPDAKPGDGAYTAGQDALISTYHIGDGIAVKYLCGFFSGAGTTCSNQGGITTLDIIFSRPNATPIITGFSGGSALPLSAACIALATPQGVARYVSVGKSGLVSASAASCP